MRRRQMKYRPWRQLLQRSTQSGNVATEIEMAVILLLACYCLLLNSVEGIEGNCTDVDGIPIRHGLIYVPGPNICTMCVCYHSGPKWCKTMFCSGPPYWCKDYRVGEKCCQFECLDPPTETPLSLQELTKMSDAHRFSADLICMIPVVCALRVFRSIGV